MISGIVLILALAAPVPPEASALVRRLARPVPAQTRFTEVRFARLLSTPLLTHGQLEYAGPGVLSRRVTAPYHETMRIAGGEAVVEREGRDARRIALANAPELRALLAGFGGLLGGDVDVVQRYFDVRLRTAREGWTLTLTPLASTGDRRLAAMIVDGSGDEPRCFALYEANGDASIMLLGKLAETPVAPTASRAQLEAVCGRVAP